MSLFGFKNNKCKEEIYTKEEVYAKEEVDTKLSGKSDSSHTHSDYKLNGDFALITGTMILTAATDAGVYVETSKDISYPDGFNKDNCIVVSIGLKTSSLSTYCYERGTDDSMDLYWGTVPRRIILDTNIQLRGYNNATSGRSIDYKIVLMKIS